MTTATKTKGTWLHRLAIRFFTLVLGLVVYWLFGFLVSDIRTIEGPDYAEIEAEYVDQSLYDRVTELDDQIAETTTQIDNLTEQQRVLGDSSQNLQQTIGQLIELQRMGLEKNIAFSETEQSNFTNSLNLFLANQQKYQELSQSVSEMTQARQELMKERDSTQVQIAEQSSPAREVYQRLTDAHRMRLAFYQLAFLVPILLVASFLMVKKRSSIYFPLFLAFGGAALVKVGFVIHEYFPTQYVKYGLIIALLLVVARLLIYFIRTVAHPKGQWLITQYRDAYERFLCPVCEYPIRTGPRRYLYWTRRTVNKNIVPTTNETREESYTCPSCGTRLFDECPSCHHIRHTMLPHCEHCGAEKSVE